MSHTTPITIQNVRFYDMMIIWQTVPLRLGVWALCRENLNFQFPLSQILACAFQIHNLQLAFISIGGKKETSNPWALLGLGLLRSLLSRNDLRSQRAAQARCVPPYMLPISSRCHSLVNFNQLQTQLMPPDRLPLTFVRVDCKKMAPIRGRYASSNVHNIARYCMIQFVMSWSWVAFDTVEVILNDWNETGPGWVKTEKVTILFFSI